MAMVQRLGPIWRQRPVERTMERFLRDFWGEDPGLETWAPPVDVRQSGDEVIVSASLPGLDPKDIHVSVEDDVLTIQGGATTEQESETNSYLLRERRTGSFYRRLRLPDTLDLDKAVPEYKNGVITIRFQKQESKKARTLELKVS